MLRYRRAATLLLLVTLGSACSSGPPAQGGAATAPQVAESRELLGDPLVALAQAGLGLAEDLDVLRHEVERGARMNRDLRVLNADVRQVRTAARTALDAARQAPVADAGAVLSQGVTDALAAASAAQAELAYLQALSRIDAALLAEAGRWDEPGSQSELRERLDAQIGRVRALRARLRKVKPQPGSCTAMVANRRRWIGVVLDRATELRDSADSAGGARYDELRDAYRRAPLAEDPVTADAKDRACWVKRSDVWVTGQDLRSRVDQLQGVLG